MKDCKCPTPGGVGYGQEGATGLRGLFKGRATCFAGEQVAQGSTGTGKGGYGVGVGTSSAEGGLVPKYACATRRSLI